MRTGWHTRRTLSRVPYGRDQCERQRGTRSYSFMLHELHSTFRCLNGLPFPNNRRDRPVLTTTFTYIRPER